MTPPSTPAGSRASSPGQASHTELLHDLGRRITAGELAPGTVFTVAGLENDYAASRTVVREAVRVLESLGMISPRRRVGLTVRPRREWHVLGADTIRWTLDGPMRRRQLTELMELRAAIEPAAARLAAERATPEERAELVRLAEKLDELGRERRGDEDAYLEVDIAFHSLLLGASDNPLFAELAGPVREILVGRTARGLTPAEPAEGTLDAHVDAARAIARGDGEAAERHVREHIAIVIDEVGEA